MDLTTLVLVCLAGALGAAGGLLAGRARLAAAQQDAGRLRTALDYERRQATERITFAEEGRDRLADAFSALSHEALSSVSRRFLDLADQRMREADVRSSGELAKREQAVEHLVTPLADTLGRLEAHLRELESARTTAYAALTEQVRMARQSSDNLRAETASLVTALRKPSVQGRWGELQLRRLLEISGLTARADFVEQARGSAGSDGEVLRPDVVVSLTGGRRVVVDAKVSLTAYLEAHEASDEATRTRALAAHARHLRAHVDTLAAKSYWQQFSPAPEFVLLFVPGDAFLAPALERDPQLLEYAFGRRVHLASPTTLVSALRTVAYAWQQQSLTEKAQEVFDLGRQLYERLGTLGGHVDRLGRSLTGAVRAYNDAVGSLESRVLVPARRLAALHVVDGELAPPPTVDVGTRPLGAAELLADADDGSVVKLTPRLGEDPRPAARGGVPGEILRGGDGVPGAGGAATAP
jgi:DNA recombination protein RmuC